MTTFARPIKQGGFQQYVDEVSAGFPELPAKELDDDLNVAFNAISSIQAVLLPDAPSNGTIYGRQNAVWAAMPTAVGIAEAPNDGALYGRKSLNWTVVPPSSGGIPDAPNDGQIYGRKSLAWAVVTGGSGGAPSGPAGGDLSGTYPNPTVIKASGGLLVGAGLTVAAGTMTNTLSVVTVATLGRDPVNPLEAATKQYVDAHGPSGAAGGDLTGTYPNPTIGAAKVTRAKTAADLWLPPIPVAGDVGKVLSVTAGPTLSYATVTGGSPWTDTGTALTPVTSTRQLVLPGPTSGTDQAIQILGTRAQKSRIFSQATNDISGMSINAYYNGTQYLPDVIGGQSWVMAFNTMNSPSPNVKFTFLDSNTPQNSWNALWFDYGGTLTIASAVATKQSGTTWANPSDRRLKDNIVDYATGLEAILQLQPRMFVYNGLGGSTAGMRGYGFIADEVQPVMPETVGAQSVKLDAADADETEIQTLDQSNMILALINATKELAARVTALEAA